jgi:hypothetical protein
MNLRGFDVKYVLDPMAGGNGEYYVYVVKDGNKTVVFSNSKKHTDAIIGNSLNSKIYGSIISKIQKIVKN